MMTLDDNKQNNSQLDNLNSKKINFCKANQELIGDFCPLSNDKRTFDECGFCEYNTIDYDSNFTVI